MRLDTRTRETRMLFKDARIGDLVFNRTDRSLWGIRHLNGIVTLVRMAHPYKEFRQVFSWPYGEIAYDLDISPDGKLLSASHTAINGDQQLQVMEVATLLAGKAVPVASFDFGTAVPEGFVFSPDGKSLYGSSYYTGVSNIYRYDLATKKIDALSNAETGFFRPLPLPDGRLLAFDFTGQGLIPGFIDGAAREDLSAVTFLGAQVAARHPIVSQWNVGSPASVNLEKATRSRGPYASLHEIGLQSYYPVLEGYKDSWAVGMHANFSDPIGLDRITVTASYSPDDELPGSERWHFDALWRHRGYRARFQHNDGDFYDLFGPTKTSRRGNAWTLGYNKALIFDIPRTMNLDIALKVYNNLDTLPGFQDVAASSDKLESIAATLDYGYVLNSLGNVDEEKGLRWNLNLDVSHANDNTIPALYGGIDFGTPFAFRHSSLWLRTGAGWADGDIDDPYANFFFGGFGNNWVDQHEVKRYREHFSFPGFEISEIAARSYFRSTLEWNLPPVRFSEFGTPANYLSWMRPAVFAGILVANPGEGARMRRLQNLGVQLDFRFNVMHEQEMTLSVGYALGFENGRSSDDEVMLSLKVLH